MKIDFFVCNPPFGDQRSSQIGKKIIKNLTVYKTVVICGPSNIVPYGLTFISSYENCDFPNIDFGTGIFTMNIGDSLYKNHYRIKTQNKSNFFIKVYGIHNKVFEHLYIRTGGKTADENKFFLDIDQQQFIKINEILKLEEQNYSDWLKMYSKMLRAPQWIYADILYKYGYTNLVEKIK